MSAPDPLSQFVHDGLRAGHDRDKIADALAATGWPRADINAALDLWADTPLGIPAPRPRAYVSARDAVLYGLILIALLALLVLAYFRPVLDPASPEMSSLRWPVIALGLFGAMIIGLGLWQTGGPARGAMEQRDQARLNDLYRLQAHVTCLLPGENAITAGPDCPDDLRLADPFTGAPYSLTATQNHGYRLCARMENAPDETRWRNLTLHDGQSCLEGRLPD